MWQRDNVSNGNSAAGSQIFKEKMNPSSNRPAQEDPTARLAACLRFPAQTGLITQNIFISIFVM